MAIIYVPKYQEYVGLSTDNKSGITTEGAIIYYSNTKKRQILHGGVWGDYVVNTDAILNTSDLEIGAVEIKNSTDDTRATVGADGLYVDIQDIESELVGHDFGTSTGGTKTTLSDTSKNYAVNVNAGKSIVMKINGVTYTRAIVSNTVDTQTFTPTLPGAVASAVVGDIGVAQITVVSDAEGTAWNSYTIEIVEGVGNNIPLSAAINGTVITVTLATDGAGALDAAANTQALVTGVVDALASFSASGTGAGGAMVATIAPIAFTGGVDIVTALSGSNYKIIDKNLRVSDASVSNSNPVPVDVRSIQSGTNFIGRSGAKVFKAMANFVRPNTVTQYSIDDAITDSASAPTIMSYDLVADGAIAGQQFMITNARVIVGSKGSAGSLNVNLWLFNATFAGTNDNVELSIDDATANTGGIVIPCLNTYSNALNHRCVSDAGQWVGKLAAADTKLYFTLQAASTFTPTAQDTIYVVFEGMLL